MELLLYRKYPKAEYTIGEIRIDGKFFSSSLEPVDRGLDSGMDPDELKRNKVSGKTAIPVGRYRIGFTYSPKFRYKSWAKPYGGKVISIENVPGFSGVRIHPGNVVADTSGCVLVGLNKIKGALTDSCRIYLDLLEHHVMPALAAGEPIYITIL